MGLALKLTLAAAALATLLSGCSGGADEATRVEGKTATVYSSSPRHGVSAAAARAVLAGERRALADADGRAGGLRIRLVELPTTTDDPAHPWDPALVSTNAHRAADDPSAIAYLGELDYGASAVSLPITNDAGLLQVSPGDGLTSLTRRPPGRPRAGPERYYPADERTFVRVGPSDLDEAEWLVERVRASGRRRLAMVFDREIYGRELAGQIATLARREGIEPVASEEFRGGPDEVPEIARELADARPDAVIYLGVATRATGTLWRGSIPRCPPYRCSRRAGSWPRGKHWRFPRAWLGSRPSAPRSRPSARATTRCASCSKPWTRGGATGVAWWPRRCGCASACRARWPSTGPARTGVSSASGLRIRMGKARWQRDFLLVKQEALNGRDHKPCLGSREGWSHSIGGTFCEYVGWQFSPACLAPSLWA